MPSIVIRLHPDKAVEPAVFTTYLQNLQIQAFDLSFTGPTTGAPAGQAASFLTAATDPPFPPDPPDYGPSAGDNTGIVQHVEVQFVGGPGGGINFWLPVSLATAVIEVPATGYENLRLAVSRGTEEIGAGGPYYNVALEPGSLTPDQFQFSGVNSLYLAIPAPITEANAVYLTLPGDGSPPPFDQLLAAVTQVLGVDPGGALPELGTLTPEQCRNIAYEIVWSSQPALPTPPDSLSDMYDDPPNSGDPSDTNEQNRRQFEGTLTSYYATPDATADRLAKWVYALAAAFACQQSSQEATQALLTFPVNPGQQTTASVAETEVMLVAPTTGAQLPVSFGVPAAYFYALGANLPVQVPPAQRYRMACADTVVRALAELTAAFGSGLIGDSYQVGNTGPAVNPAQAARRLAALGVPTASRIPQCPMTAALQPMVTDWLAYPPPPPPAASTAGLEYLPARGRRHRLLAGRGHSPASSVPGSGPVRADPGLCPRRGGLAAAGTATAARHDACRRDPGLPGNDHRCADGGDPGRCDRGSVDQLFPADAGVPAALHQARQPGRADRGVHPVRAEVLRADAAGLADFVLGATARQPASTGPAVHGLAPGLPHGLPGDHRRWPAGTRSRVQRRDYAAGSGDRVPRRPGRPGLGGAGPADPGSALGPGNGCRAQHPARLLHR